MSFFKILTVIESTGPIVDKQCLISAKFARRQTCPTPRIDQALSQNQKSLETNQSDEIGIADLLGKLE